MTCGASSVNTTNEMHGLKENELECDLSIYVQTNMK